MTETTAGLLHPGEMGSAVGVAVRAAGSRVVWASEGRSQLFQEAMVVLSHRCGAFQRPPF